MEILTQEGELVRAFSTEPDSDQGEGRLEAEAGMNRHVWNLRYPDIYRVPGLYVFGSLQGRRVVPGIYTARLTVGQEERSIRVEVVGDPRLNTPLADYLAQDEFAARIAAETEAIHRAVSRIGKVREQIEAILERAMEEEGEGSEEVLERVVELGTALADSLTMVEDSLVQWKTYDGQTVLNAPSRLNFQYIYLMGNVTGADDGVTQGAREVFRDLNARWYPLRDRLGALLDQDVAAFNQEVRRAGIQPVGMGGG
jgi:hypothetical protein